MCVTSVSVPHFRSVPCAAKINSPDAEARTRAHTTADIVSAFGGRMTADLVGAFGTPLTGGSGELNSLCDAHRIKINASVISVLMYALMHAIDASMTVGIRFN